MAVSKKAETINIDIVKLQGHINSSKYQNNDLGTIAISIPRSELCDTFTEIELYHNCLYFLFGQDENKEVVYVGQAKKRNAGESALKRIKEHDTATNESYHGKWNQVVIVTNKDDVWTIDDVCALEKAFFIEIGKDNRLNDKKPNYGGNDFERFKTKIEQVKLLITAIGFNIFSEKTNVDNVQIVTDYTNFSVEDLHNWGSAIPEIITPSKVVKKMVDLLPDSVWNDKTVFLDPACKGGEYLKEIYDRLMESEYMKTKYPNDFARSTHILKNQLYGIALSKVSYDRTTNKLFGENRNIKIIHNYIERLKDIQKYGTTAYNEKQLTFKGLIEEVFETEMNIDVIISNPPYQESTGGGKSGGTAIWTNFIELAKELSNQTVIMITPSRWFTGGQGISKDWRKNWINDIHLDTLIHYSDASELFPGTSIAGGVSYFRWNKEVNNYGEADTSKNMVRYENVCMKQSVLRQLNEDEVVNAIVRKERQSIINKVKKYCLDNNIKTITNGFWGEHYAAYTHSVTSGNSDYKQGEVDILILNNKKPCLGKIEKEKIKYTPELNTYRVVVGGVGAIEKEKDNWVIHNIGVIKPGVVHNNSFLTLVFDGKEETCINVANYLKLKLPRLLIMHVSASALSVAVSSYRLVPLLDFSHSYTDDDLYKLFELTQEEINYIESTIKHLD